MRKWIVQWVVLACAWGGLSNLNAASFSWRFVGLNALKEKKDLVVFQEVSGLPEFSGFQSNVAFRVSKTLAPAIAKSGNEAAVADLLNPIAADLAAFQTIYEHETTNGSNLWALAIRLPADRHEVWKKNWEGIEKLAKAPATLSREGEWSVLGNNSTKSVLEKSKKNIDDVLQVQGDATMLQKIWPALNPSNVDLHVSAQGKSLRTEGKIQFEKDIPIKFTKWEIPTNTISDPLIGFTAVQGTQEYLSRTELFKNRPAPNQLFLWSEYINQFSMYVAGKVDDAKGFLKAVPQDLRLTSRTNIVGEFQFDTNTFASYLKGLPIIIPFVRSAHPKDANFVYAGVWPANFGTNGMPAELVGEIVNRTNLVYYDWEISGARLEQYRPLRQIPALASNKPMPSYESAASKWMIATQPKLGNSVTEITKTGPRELTFVRRSDLGLSALELFAFVEWVSGPPPQRPPGAGKPAPASKPPASPAP